MKNNKKWLIIGAIGLLAAGAAFFYFKKRKNILDEINEAEEAKPEEVKAEKAPAAAPVAASKLPLGDLVKPTIQNTGINPAAPVKTIVKPVGSIPAKAITVTATKPVATVAAPAPAGTAKMLRAVEDMTKHMAILRVSPKNMFKVGDSVKVSGNVYKGTFKIWYIYKSHATEDALYIDTPFKGDDSGTVTK